MTVQTGGKPANFKEKRFKEKINSNFINELTISSCNQAKFSNQGGEELLTSNKRIEDLFPIRKNQDILKILLKDRTTNRNILWATDNYYSINPKDIMKSQVISNGGSLLVRPRVEKSIAAQANRTKEKAEVFTPTWIVKKQNDIIEEEFKDLELVQYVGKIWLEITCGEAPYMTSRYDAVTGENIPLSQRVGFVDRKLQRISNETNDSNAWMEFTIKAFQASYGYEFHGDSLIIARENLLYSFLEFYIQKFDNLPAVNDIAEIAKIISYNVFQMDGLKYIVPYSEELVSKQIHTQLSLFDTYNEPEEIEVVANGTSVKIRNWKTNKMIEFESIITGGFNYEI